MLGYVIVFFFICGNLDLKESDVIVMLRRERERLLLCCVVSQKRVLIEVVRNTRPRNQKQKGSGKREGYNCKFGSRDLRVSSRVPSLSFRIGRLD